MAVAVAVVVAVTVAVAIDRLVSDHRTNLPVHCVVIDHRAKIPTVVVVSVAVMDQNLPGGKPRVDERVHRVAHGSEG